MKRDTNYTIIYQNQSDKALRWFENCGICPDLLDVCLTSDLMTEFTLTGPTKETMERFKVFKGYIDEKYKSDIK
jgi:hypothetical protein